MICHKVCEVAVPESKYMGYSCSEVRITILQFLSCKNFLFAQGTFCCRRKAKPGLPDPDLLQESVDK